VERRNLEIEWEATYWHMYGPHRRLTTGLELLVAQAVDSDILCAVASSASAASIRWTLDGFAVSEHFQTLVCASDVKNGKPAPDVFLEAATRCGVAPDNCIVFEDAPAGIQAARKAGMRAVALTTTFPASAFSEFDNVIAVARDFAGLSVTALFACQLVSPVGIPTSGCIRRCA
jgi:beta-phosphoglucomutase-like phosphatase (HAD superfamily)